MGMAMTARFFAAATLTVLLAAPLAAAPAAPKGGAWTARALKIADKEYGKEYPLDGDGNAGKQGQPGGAPGAKAGGDQTARQPVQGGGKEGEYGVERPAPEGTDPNEGDGSSGNGGKSDLPPGDE
jgi:hypothetical protein